MLAFIRVGVGMHRALGIIAFIKVPEKPHTPLQLLITKYYKALLRIKGNCWHNCKTMTFCTLCLEVAKCYLLIPLYFLFIIKVTGSVSVLTQLTLPRDREIHSKAVDSTTPNAMHGKCLLACLQHNNHIKDEESASFV